MNVTVEKLDQLRSATQSSLDELAQDAQQYLDMHRRWQQRPQGSAARQDLEAELDVQVTVLMAHATTTHDLMEEVTDSLPNEDE